MRVLLDACVPRQLARWIEGHEVRTAFEMGWGDLDDGPLLDQLAGAFEGLVTVDRGLPRQQRIDHRSFGVILLRAKTNRLADLLPLTPALNRALPVLQPGEVLELTD